MGVKDKANKEELQRFETAKKELTIHKNWAEISKPKYNHYLLQHLKIKIQSSI